MFFSGGIAAAVAAFSAIGVYMNYCSHTECCRSPWVTSLEIEYATAYHSFSDLIGQPLVVRMIKHLSMQRMSSKRPPKPLVLSFHGPTGVGKTYLSSKIAELLFKLGINSKYFHFYDPGSKFPNPNKVFEYREMLVKQIMEGLKRCEYSVFVFDEFHTYPEGLDFVIAPFLDSNPTIPNQKAVFIFLSNTGEREIVSKTHELSKANVEREDFQISDFQKDLEKAVYNENGTWKGSPIVTRYLIDAYIPFLPLERRHVQECIKAEFLKYGEAKVKPDAITQIMKGISFSEYGDYSGSGCRRVKQLVSNYQMGAEKEETKT